MKICVKIEKYNCIVYLSFPVSCSKSLAMQSCLTSYATLYRELIGHLVIRRFLCSREKSTDEPFSDGLEWHSVNTFAVIGDFLAIGSEDHINQMWNFRTACYYPAGDFSLTERLVSFLSCLFCGLLFLVSVLAGFDWVLHLRGIKRCCKESWELSRRLSLWMKTLAAARNYCRSWRRDLFIYPTVQQKCFINSFYMAHLHRFFRRCSVLDNLPRMPEWLSITRLSLWPLEV